MNSFKAPRVIETFGQDFLNDVRDVVADEFEPSECWHDGGVDWTPDAVASDGLLHVLAPLTAVVLRDQRRVPDRIRYAVSIGEIAPGETQRGSGWHVDSGKNYGQYLLSDALPTEFLVRTPGCSALLKIVQQKRYQKRKHLYPWRGDDTDITSLGLSVMTPDILDVVRIRDHIHRSPINITTQSIQRTFIRASIHKE